MWIVSRPAASAAALVAELWRFCAWGGYRGGRVPVVLVWPKSVAVLPRSMCLDFRAACRGMSHDGPTSCASRGASLHTVGVARSIRRRCLPVGDVHMCLTLPRKAAARRRPAPVFCFFCVVGLVLIAFARPRLLVQPQPQPGPSFSAGRDPSTPVARASRSSRSYDSTARSHHPLAFFPSLEIFCRCRSRCLPPSHTPPRLFFRSNFFWGHHLEKGAPRAEQGSLVGRATEEEEEEGQEEQE